jgi:hypothetical protein
LITIFEHEWQNKKSQIIGVLESKLMVAQIKLTARKCVLDHSVSTAETNEFLKENHIFGSGVWNFSIGLRSKDGTLVGLVTCSRHHRQGNTDSMVLSRLAFKRGILIVGGAGRLFEAAKSKAAVMGANKLVTWSDNRFSLGGVYKTTGWTEAARLRGDYFYYHTELKKVYSKQSCTKKNLRKKLTKASIPFDESMREHELARLLGLYRVWDCGKVRWEIDLHQAALP